MVPLVALEEKTKKKMDERWKKNYLSVRERINVQRPLALHQPGQVVALDVLHREDEALAEPRGRVGRHDVRVP